MSATEMYGFDKLDLWIEMLEMKTIIISAQFGRGCVDWEEDVVKMAEELRHGKLH